MITEQLVAEAIARSRGDKNAYRIASYIAYLGHSIGSADMNAIRDILGEAHPDLRDDAKPREPKGFRKQKQGEGFHKRTPSHKGKAL